MKILHTIILILKGILFWSIILFIVLIIKALDSIIVYLGLAAFGITLLLLLVLFLSLKFFFSKKERYLISGMCLIELVYRTLSEYIIKVNRVKRIKKLRKGVRTEKKEEKTEANNQKEEKS